MKSLTDRSRRPMSFQDYVYWGIFIFLAVFVGQLLVSLIEVSSVEEVNFLSTSGLERQIMTTSLVLSTTEGPIEIRLLRQQAPVSTNNISELSRSGYYDGTKFHRVVPGVLIEGGDPLSREKNKDLWGTGGPGYVLEDENVSAPMTRGTVALSNRGKPGTSGSQFFIVTAEEAPSNMSERHSVIGRVVRGMEVVDRIAQGELDEENRPIAPVVIREAYIKR